MTLYPNGIDNATTLPPVTPGSGIATPIGPAGGDLSGNYPDPTVSGGGGGFTPGGDLAGTSTHQTVIGIQGNAVPAPTGTNTVLEWSGSALSWGAGGGGGGLSNVFVYRQGATPVGNVYATFATAYAARAAARTAGSGFAILEIDSSLGSPQILAGAYDFTDTKLLGNTPMLGEPSATSIIINDGATFTNLVDIENANLEFNNTSGSPITLTGVSQTIVMRHSVIYTNIGGAQPVWNLLSGASLLVLMFDFSYFDTNPPIFNVDATSTVNLTATSQSIIGGAVASGVSGATLSIIGDGTSTVNDQSGFGGTYNPFFYSNLQNIQVPIPSGTNTVLTYNTGAYTWASGGGGASFDSVDIENDSDGGALDGSNNWLVLLLGFSTNHAKFLPGTPTVGQRVTFKDYDGSFANFQFTIHRNGQLINGVAADYVINNSPFIAITIQYASSAQGWVIVTPNTVPSGATGSRPTLSAANTGVIFFDTTLHYLVTWDGSVWRNGAGAAV